MMGGLNSITGNKIESMPIRPLESLFGALPELDIEQIRREHEDEVKNEHWYCRRGDIR